MKKDAQRFTGTDKNLDVELVRGDCDAAVVRSRISSDTGMSLDGKAMAEDQEFLHYVTTRSPVRKTASRQVLSLVRCRNVFPTFEQSLQVIHAYQQRSKTNKNCKRR